MVRRSAASKSNFCDSKLRSSDHHILKRNTRFKQKTKTTMSADGGAAESFDNPAMAAAAEGAASDSQVKVSVKALPIRSYLDQTVAPLLLQGMTQLVKERCNTFELPCSDSD